jgi:hypothetical protein
MKHLKHKSQLAGPKGSSRSAAERVEILSFDGDLPPIGSQHPTEGHQEGRFATAARTADADKLFLGDLQVQIVQDANLAAAGREASGNMLE